MGGGDVCGSCGVVNWFCECSYYVCVFACVCVCVCVEGVSVLHTVVTGGDVGEILNERFMHLVGEPARFIPTFEAKRFDGSAL